MAVRLRSVTEAADEPAEITTGWDEALIPSRRILGGSLADKLGGRMGLRLSDNRTDDHFVPEQRSTATV